MRPRKNKFRHNKKRNTAFLFEVLVKELTKASLQKDEERKDKVVGVIKRHFSKGTPLHKELDVYRALSETRGVSAEAAERMLSEAKRAYALIPTRSIFDSQSEAIADISSELGTEVYANFVPNYKDLATLSQIFNEKGPLATRVLMEQKQVEIMTSLPEEPQGIEHISNLTYKSFTKRFNKEYSGKLHEEQSELLNRFIYSFSDNGVGLKTYLNEEIGRLKRVVEESFNMKEIKEDQRMLSNAKRVLETLDNFKQAPLTESDIKKILKIQELAREVSE